MRCRKCGYPEDAHEIGTKKCPICACGEVPAKHYRGVETSPLCPALCMGCGKVVAPPDGTPHRHRPYRLNDKDEALSLRQGKFERADEGPAPIDERVARIIGVELQEQAAEVTDQYRPPMVRARLPRSRLEYAGYGGRQAVGLGRRAALVGWSVRPLYWRAGDGAEGCGVWLWKDDLRAVATWKRPSTKAGMKSGWGADIAYAWRADVQRFPTKLNHTQLDELIS